MTLVSVVRGAYETRKPHASTRGWNSFSDKSLSHTRWNCKYHIVFTPKYRRKVIYGELRKDIGRILRKLCEMKEVEIIEAHAMPDHIHMLVNTTKNKYLAVHGLLERKKCDAYP